MKYKVGDKVRVVETPIMGMIGIRSMTKLCGQVVTIKEVSYGNLNFPTYVVEETKLPYRWTDSHFTELVTEVKEIDMTKKELKSKVEELEKELAKFKKELDEKDKSPYGDMKVKEGYWTILSTGTVMHDTDCYHSNDRSRFARGNYFSDASFAKKVAAEQTLTNLLRKYTYEHGWSDDLWDDKDTPKYCVYYNGLSKQMTLDYWFSNKYLGVIYFVDKKTASNAIQEVVIPFVKEHPELGYELKD